MSETNPYQFKAVEAELPAEAELLDEEARHRIAEALAASHRPMQVIAVVVVFAAMMLCTLSVLIVVGFIGGAVNEFSLGVTFVGGLIVAGLMTLAVSAFRVAILLWSGSVAAGRAKTRLTIASLASAVQAQTLFWKKLAFLCVAVVVFCAALTALYFAHSS